MKLEARKGALESKGLTVNINKTKMMTSSENATKVTKCKFSCTVYRKSVDKNSVFRIFCRCWMHEINCSGIRGKLKEDSEFKCKTHGKLWKSFCYLGARIRAGRGAIDSVTTSNRSGWNKFRDLVTLLTSRDLY